MGDFIPQVQPKKVHYILKNRSFGYYSVDGSNFHGLNRAKATQFSSIERLLTEYGSNAVHGSKTYSSNLDIIRVEETAGVPSRRVATCSETPTGYVIKDGRYEFLRNPDLNFGEGWTTELEKAKMFISEKEAIGALLVRSQRISVTRSSYTIARIIDVPATPLITETVLS